jgi:hypothetical protein
VNRLQTASAWAFYVATRAWLFRQWSGPNAWMYAYFADAVSVGRNPYTMPQGTVDPSYADYPPIWMVLFGSLAQWLSGDTAVKVVCYAGDALLFAATMRMAATRNGADRLWTVALALANPGYLFADIAKLQYKSWAAAGLIYLTWADSAVVVGLLAGAFLLPALILPMRITESRKLKELVTASAVAIAMWVPWFPDSLMAVAARRTSRAALAPQSEALAWIFPAWCVPILPALGAGVAALLIVQGKSSVPVRFAGAAVAIISTMSESQMNRWLPFALVVFIAAPTGARVRWIAFGLCAIGGAGLWHKLVLGKDVFNLLAINSAVPLAIISAYRGPLTSDHLRDQQIIPTPEVIEQVGGVDRRV